MEASARAAVEAAQRFVHRAEQRLEEGRVPAAMFHCHQALEHGMRAMHRYQHGSTPATHNLAELSDGLNITLRYRRIFAHLDAVFEGYRRSDRTPPRTPNPEHILRETRTVVAAIAERVGPRSAGEGEAEPGSDGT